jgi:hypothetical protein
MKLKTDKVYELMNTHYKGNYTQFAKAIELDPSHIHRFLRLGIGGGKKVIGAVMRFAQIQVCKIRFSHLVIT